MLIWAVVNVQAAIKPDSGLSNYVGTTLKIRLIRFFLNLERSSRLSFRSPVVLRDATRHQGRRTP